MHSQHTNHPSFRANLSWEDVETAADESPAVKSISCHFDHYEICWVDGSKDKYTDPQAARIAIKEME